jgi:tetratricopeptide (TPR) repeat protein
MRFASWIVMALIAGIVSTNAALGECEGVGDSKSLAGAVIQGDCLRKANHLDEAISAYRRGLKIDPNGSRDLFLGLSGTYLDGDRTQSALEAGLAADRLSPNDPTVLVEVGMALEVLRAYPESLEYFQRTVALRPGDGRAQRSVGFVLRQMDRPDEALEPLLKAVAIDPNDWRAQYNLGGAYGDIYRQGKARIEEISMHGGASNSPPYLERDALVKKLKNTDYIGKAIEHSREATRLNPDNHELWYGLAHDLSDFRQKDDTERLEAFKRSLSLKPDYYRALHDLAIAYFDNRRYAESYETLDTLEKAHGDDRDIEWQRGQLDLSTKRYDDAVKHFTAAISKDPKNPMLHANLARAYRKLARNEDSQHELDRAKELAPKEAGHWEFIAKSN